MNNNIKETIIIVSFLISSIFILNLLFYKNIIFIVKENTAVVSIEKYLIELDRYETCIENDKKEKCSTAEKRMLTTRNVMDTMLQRLYE